MPIKVKKSINVPQYYKDFIEENKIKRERARITVDELTSTIAAKRSAIVPDVDKFKYPVIDYPEFQQFYGCNPNSEIWPRLLFFPDSAIVLAAFEHH